MKSQTPGLRADAQETACLQARCGPWPPPTFFLPCRRSRVRIPSAALRKGLRFAGLSAFGDFLRLLSFHRPRAFLSVGMRPAAGRGSGPGLTAGQQPEGLVDRQPRTCSSCSGPFPRGRAPAGSRHSPYSLRWPRSPHSPHSCCGVGRCLTWPARCGSCAFVEGKRRDAVSYRDLAGTIAVVTGGSRGIGAETARRLVANGAKVAVVGRDGAAIDALVERGPARGRDGVRRSGRCDALPRDRAHARPRWRPSWDRSMRWPPSLAVKACRCPLRRCPLTGGAK